VHSTLLVWLGFSALAIAGFAATAVYAFRDFSRAQLRELLRARGIEPRFDEIIRSHLPAALGAESLRVFATAAAVFAAATHLWTLRGQETYWPALLGVTLAQVIAGAVILWLAIIWLPAALARVWAESFIARTWPLWRGLGRLFAPSFVGSQLVERAFHRISGKAPSSLTEEELEEEIREVVTEGQREGLIEEEAREMIESVMSLGEVQVKNIMTPRTDMVTMPVDLSWEEALQQVINSGHTRIPLHGKDRDEIVGILHTKDMLHELARGPQTPHRPIAELARQPFFVPESKAVDDLLQEFQRSRNHIAVVMDEFGGVSGLVTIEDVLEEIVGEIADEHDEAAGEGIHSTGERSCEALARVHIGEINERLGLHLPEDEHFNTIGGFVFHQLGRIPHVGETLMHDGVKIKVLDATRRRINRLALEVIPPAEGSEGENAACETRGAP
jgi:CBS domain containing-hemolysin-like protein